MRGQPHNDAVEKQVLAAVIDHDGHEAIAALVDAGCTADWFYRIDNKAVWEAAVALYQDRQPIDEITLADRLTRTGDLEKLGGHSMLTAIAGSSDVPMALFHAHLKRLQGYATLRAAIRFSFKIMESVGEVDPVDSEAWLAERESELYALSRDVMRKTNLEHLSAPADRAVERIRQALETKGQTEAGIQFGLSQIDATMGGLKPKEVTVLAARPSVGKTSLAMALVQRAGILERKETIVFSLETDSDTLVQRMIYARAGIDSVRIKRGLCDDDEARAIAVATKEIKQASVYIDETPRMTMALIAARARRHASRLKGRKLDLLVVDYLQLIQPSDPKAIREQQIAAISRELKLLCKELGCAGLILCQLNRESVRDNRPPRTSDLRESGAIEQDADVILFLYRPLWEEGCHPNLVMADVHKNRNGETSTFHGRLHFDKALGRFTDMASPADDHRAATFVASDNSASSAKWSRDPSGG